MSTLDEAIDVANMMEISCLTKTKDKKRKKAKKQDSSDNSDLETSFSED